MKKQLTCLVLVTLMFTAAGVLSAQSEMSAALIGAEEVPAVVTAAFGSASFDVNFSESTLGMNYELSATNLKDAFMAHVHCAPAGTNGPIVLWLAGRPSSPATAAYDIDGPWVSSAKVDDNDVAGPTPCADQAGNVTMVNNLIDLIGVMAAGNTYVNIHTTAHGGGEIRGQVKLVAGFSIP